MWPLRRREHWDDRPLTVADLLVFTGVLSAVAVSVMATASTGGRTADLRNAMRRAAASSFATDLAVHEARAARGDRALRIDADPRTAQVLVADTRGVTCALGLMTTPHCPGAIRPGLLVAATDCVVQAVAPPTDPFASVPSAAGRILAPSRVGRGNSGYYVNRTADGMIEVGACYPERGELIREFR